MVRHGRIGWGGSMRDYLQPIEGVEDLTDSVEKIAPAIGAAIMSGGRAVMSSPTGRKVVAQGAMMGVDALKNKLQQKQEETQQAEEELRMAEEQQAQQEQQNQTMPDQPATEEGQGAEITGMQNPDSPPPTDQEGTELPTEAPAPPQVPLIKYRTWFPEHFGMTGREVTEILVKAKENKVLDAIQPLLKLEKQAILDQFVGVDPQLYNELPLTDLDYDALNQNSERLNLPFRRFVKTWESDSSEESRESATRTWRTTIDKSERLSHRERSILNGCRGILAERGALNAQTLKAYGIQASPAEISSLIKSHGFLFDIISIGQFTKSQGRGLFYDIRRGDVILKDADSFLAGLIENGGRFKFDSRLYPRLEIDFRAPTAPWYVEALNKQGLGNVSAKGRGLVIEGQDSVKKALEIAEPHLNGNSRGFPSARNMLKALRGDNDTLMVIAYESLNKTEKTQLLRKHKLSVDDFDQMREEVLASG